MKDRHLQDPPEKLNEKQHLSRGFVWLGAASSATAIIDGLSSLIIVWYLTREEMGLATLSWAVAVFIEAFNGLGIGMALVQAKKLSERQRSFCHTYAVAFSVAATSLTCLAAPFISSFYESPELTPMICVSALKLLFVGACLVPLQSLNRNLEFSKVSIILTAATFFAACLRIGLAAAGAGAWAPVIGNTAHGVFVFLGVLIAYRPWPRPSLAWRESRGLITFGWKLTFSGAIYQFYRNADFFLVGRFLGTELLGLYRVAYDLAMVPALMILNVVNRASFPVYSRLSGDLHRLLKTFTWNVRNLTLLILPLCLAIGFAGPSILQTLGRTSQWAEAGTAVYILSIAACLRCLDQIFPQLFAAAGHATYSLLDSLFSAIVFCTLFTVSLMLFGDTYNIVAVCVAWPIGYLILFIPLWLLTRRVLPIHLRPFLVSVFKDPLRGTLITATPLLAANLLLSHFQAPPWTSLTVLFSVATATYLLWLRFDLKVSIKTLLRSTKTTD